MIWNFDMFLFVLNGTRGAYFAFLLHFSQSMLFKKKKKKKFNLVIWS